jgi:GNAT superfamily N-acetyltransferase
VTSTSDVRSASSASEQQAVVAVITLAFSTDPMTRWTFPDPVTYLMVMPQLARAFGGNGFAHGSAHLAGDGAAAAMWLPPGVHADGERLTALTGEHAPRERRGDMERVFAQMETYHPSEPCWYLPLIGVDPARQGRGSGSSLLRHALAQCDRDGMPASQHPALSAPRVRDHRNDPVGGLADCRVDAASGAVSGRLVPAAVGLTCYGAANYLVKPELVRKPRRRVLATGR